METTDTVGTYLIKKLHEYGVGHIFGIPGDYIPHPIKYKLYLI
jgi:TPP-dependent 2-oxoacid decarboxylase